MDAVVPAVPLRHYVLSLPFELSLLAAINPKVLRALARINCEGTAKYGRGRAAARGVVRKTHAGALTFVHRFGSSLNLHLHLHVCVFDGVFVQRHDQAPQFCPARPLSKDDIRELVERVAVRMAKGLRKHGFVRHEQDSDSNEIPAHSFDEMLARVAAGRGTFEKTKKRHGDTQASSSETNPRPPSCDGAATFCGFNLHAPVRIAAGDDRGRERLFRYCLRPLVSLDRLGGLRERLVPREEVRSSCLSRANRDARGISSETLCVDSAAVLSLDAVSRGDCSAVQASQNDRASTACRCLGILLRQVEDRSIAGRPDDLRQ